MAIRFVGNQFRSETVDGPQRSRAFMVDEPGYETPGIITAVPDLKILRIVTSSPPTSHEFDVWGQPSDPNYDVDAVVNLADRAAELIAYTLGLTGVTYTILHS